VSAGPRAGAFALAGVVVAGCVAGRHLPSLPTYGPGLQPVGSVAVGATEVFAIDPAQRLHRVDLWPSIPTSEEVSLPQLASEVAATPGEACVLTVEGEVYCSGTAHPQSAGAEIRCAWHGPNFRRVLINVATLGAYQDRFCALLRDQSLVCWGWPGFTRSDVEGYDCDPSWPHDPVNGVRAVSNDGVLCWSVADGRAYCENPGYISWESVGNVDVVSIPMDSVAGSAGIESLFAVGDQVCRYYGSGVLSCCAVSGREECRSVTLPSRPTDVVYADVPLIVVPGYAPTPLAWIAIAAPGEARAAADPRLIEFVGDCGVFVDPVRIDCRTHRGGFVSISEWGAIVGSGDEFADGGGRSSPDAVTVGSVIGRRPLSWSEASLAARPPSPAERTAFTRARASSTNHRETIVRLPELGLPTVPAAMNAVGRFESSRPP